MKRIKKIAALMMTAIMALAMSITALADEADEPAKTTYEIYQIFTGEYSEGVLSNIMWGQNAGVGENEIGKKVGDNVLSILTELEGRTEEAKAELISQFVNFESEAIEKVNGEDADETTGEITVNVEDAGYYLIRSGSVGANESYTLYVVQVTDGTLKFTPKVGVPTVDKKIVENTEKVETNEASIGDDVNYEITGTMPSNIDVYKEYTYIFTDTLSKGLTYKEDSIKVTVNNVDVTDYFYKNVTERDTTAGTTITVGIQDLKALSLLTDPKVGAITAKTNVVLTYTAVLNTDAVIAGDGNPNDVILNYSNDPNHSGEGATVPPSDEPKEPTHPSGETPKKEVVTYTTELAILKVNQDGDILEGAEFTLTGDGVKVSLVETETFEPDEKGAYWKLANGSYTTIAPVTADDGTNNEADYDLAAGKFNLVRTITTATDPTKAVATIDSDGRVTFTGLGAGTYTIKESKTPAGYNTIEDVTFTVTFDATAKTFSADNVSLGVNNTLETTIVNQKGSLLPSTGGIGTTIFYVVGAILVIGAGIILVTKKRMSKEV